jgi:hypothetical protein
MEDHPTFPFNLFLTTLMKNGVIHLQTAVHTKTIVMLGGFPHPRVGGKQFHSSSQTARASVRGILLQTLITVVHDYISKLLTPPSGGMIRSHPDLLRVMSVGYMCKVVETSGSWWNFLAILINYWILLYNSQPLSMGLHRLVVMCHVSSPWQSRKQVVWLCLVIEVNNMVISNLVSERELEAVLGYK